MGPVLNLRSSDACDYRTARVSPQRRCHTTPQCQVLHKAHAAVAPVIGLGVSFKRILANVCSVTRLPSPRPRPAVLQR